MVRKLGDSPAFSEHNGHFYARPLPPCAHLFNVTAERSESADQDDAYYSCWVRHLATTDHHPVGTCKMGPRWDPMAVVDHRLRVRGLRKLRVVDGSVMPVITSGNINTPIIMIAERAADFIKQEHGRLK